MERIEGPGPEAKQNIAKWVIPAVVACATLLGFGTLAVVLVFVLEPPEWVTIAMGVGLAVGTAAFAWLVALALGAGRPSRTTQAGSGGESGGKVRRLPDRS
jgi:hypothetical protein